MSAIEYDPSRRALYNPEERETVFEVGREYSPEQLAIEAARLAYVRAEESTEEKQRLANALSRVRFGEPKLFADQDTDTQAFGAYRPDDRTALVSFRGTQPDKAIDLATDLKALPIAWTEAAGHVHAGFAGAARAILPQAWDWLDRECADREKLILAGHSLGAALATLAASVRRPTLLITLGSPRVGNAAFAARLAGVNGSRIADCCDAVTQVPPESPSYTHVRPPTYITKDGAAVDNPDAGFIRSDQWRGRMEYVAKYSFKIGTVWLRGFADHAPINYARAFF